MCERNNEVRRRKCYCRGKAVSITYCERVSSISHPACKAHARYYIVICGLSYSTIVVSINS
jgi:hypothetical protein